MGRVGRGLDANKPLNRAVSSSCLEVIDDAIQANDS